MNVPRHAVSASNAASSRGVDPEIEKVVQARGVRGRRSLDEWLAILDELAQVNERNKSACTKMLVGGAACFLATVIVLAIGSQFRYYWGIGLALPAGVAAAYLFIRAWQLRKLKMNEAFRTALIPFLKIIAEDLDPKKPIELGLNLSGPSKDKLVSKETLPKQVRFSKVVRTVYFDPWCLLSARLANRGKLFLKMSDVYHMDNRRYSRRGKIKWKKVWKRKVRVTAGLVPGLGFVFDRVAAEAVAMKHKAVSPDGSAIGKFKIKVAGKAGLQFGRLTREFKFKEVNKAPQETVSADDLIGMFFQVASMLRPVQQRRTQ